MAKLVYGLNQSLDGYVDHMKIGPPDPALSNGTSLVQDGPKPGQRLAPVENRKPIGSGDILLSELSVA
jgi:hypothetical protein